MISNSLIFVALFLISIAQAASINNEVDDSTITVTPTTTATTIAATNETAGPVTEKCLKCICEHVTGCDLDYGSNGYTSGPFRITHPFWVEADRPTISGSNPSDFNAFVLCTLNYECAARTVQQYMKNFQQDCDKDGVIDCYDFGVIHMLGRHDCINGLPSYFERKYRDCLEPSTDPKV